MKKQFLFLMISLSFVFNQAQAKELVATQLSSQENIQKTLYIYRPLINGYDLHHWAQEQGISILSEDILHVTLAYSRGGLENWSEAIESDSTYYCNSDPAHLRHLDFFGKEKSVLVLKLNAPELVKRWEELIATGTQWDWPNFQPHVTLTYEAKDMDLNLITPYHGELIFGPEVCVEIN